MLGALPANGPALLCTTVKQFTRRYATNDECSKQERPARNSGGAFASVSWDYGNASLMAAASAPTVPSGMVVSAPTVDKKLESGVISRLVA